MALRPYEDITGPLIIPVRGKTYPLPVISMADGLRIHASYTGGPDLSINDLTDIILGDAKEQMLADGVPLAVIDRALWAGIADFQHGRDTAEAVWENGAPKAAVEELARILQQAQMTPTDAETTTPPPASGTGTNAPKTPAPRSRGKKSSPTTP
jgi:hypothetical protein